MIFETERLLVRELTPEDLPELHRVQSSAKVMRYTSGQAQTYEENKADLERLMQRYQDPDNNFWVWAVVQQADGHFIGTCALICNPDGEWELGFRFGEDAWGKGYGTEACLGLQAHARKTGLKQLVAYVYDEHTGSIKMLEKSGMSLEKRFYNDDIKAMDRKYTLILS